MKTNHATMCLVITLFAAANAHAARLDYRGDLVSCSAACNDISILSLASAPDVQDGTRVVLSQQLPIDAPLDVTLPGDAIGDFSLYFRRPSAPTVDPVLGPSDQCPPPNAEGQLCNFDTVSPWVTSNEFGEITGVGTALEDESFSSGQVSVVLTQEPFVRNDARFTVDLATGNASLTLLDGLVTIATFEGNAAFRFDSDEDGIVDAQDNCAFIPNASQYDSNEDGFGNRCDGDVNNDCFVNAADLAIFRLNFFTAFPDTDFNNDGPAATIDLGILRLLFFKPPGPSAFASCDTETSR